jgi:molecular chaperone DnaK
MKRLEFRYPGRLSHEEKKVAVGSRSAEDTRLLKQLLENLETMSIKSGIGEATYDKLRNEYRERLHNSRSESKRILGIDFGTTSAAAAIVLDGTPTMIPLLRGTAGTNRIPCCVSILDSGKTIVGEPARKQAIRSSDRTLSSIKRHLAGGHRVVVAGREWRSEEIAALILGELREAAEDFLNENISKAVIAVPSSFSLTQRLSVLEAAHAAGLSLARIIGEANAAALAYARRNPRTEGKVMAVDFGGGKVDVAVVDIGGGVFQVLATSGDAKAGAVDVDKAVVEYLVDECRRQVGADPSVDMIAMTRLNEAAEKARIELSTLLTAEIDLPYIVQGRHLHMTLTRAKFEKLALPVVERIATSIRRTIQDAKVKPSDLNRIVLVGGSIGMPIVQRTIHEILGNVPRGGIDPLEAVAMGAAIQGAVLAGEVRDLLVLDVTTLSLGVETLGGVFTKVIERNTTIPTRRSQIFTTAADFQTAVTIHLLEGERGMASDNLSLGMFNLVGIPPAPRGVPQIEVTFDIDASGILNVSAKDLGTGREQRIAITASTKLPLETKHERAKQEPLVPFTGTPRVAKSKASRIPNVSITEKDKKYMKQCRVCGAWSPKASETCRSCKNRFPQK